MSSLSFERTSHEKPIHVAVTGAAGQIGYSLLFRLASGEVFGADQPVHLHLVELPMAVKAAEGTAMEIEDCGFATLDGITIADNPEQGFDGVNWALLVGSKPRGPGMERNDLIKENGPIFVGQGKALAKAASDVRCVVVGNPCNTNALIAQHACRDIPATRFSAMTALDEGRARNQIAKKAGVPVGDVYNMAIWGNHSSTMFPDFENAIIGGKKATDIITDRAWLESDFITTVQKRGAAIIAARGKSSAASAASACIDHVKNFYNKTPREDSSLRLFLQMVKRTVSRLVLCTLSQFVRMVTATMKSLLMFSCLTLQKRKCKSQRTSFLQKEKSLKIFLANNFIFISSEAPSDML